MTATPFKTGSILLLVGTKQGLFLLSSADRHQWQIEKTHLGDRSSSIYYAIFDPARIIGSLQPTMGRTLPQ
jgi:hypothetical protein